MVEVNRAASIATANITETPDPVGFTDTEIELTLPTTIITEDFPPTELADKIYKYCQRYVLCTKDISFDIKVIDKTKSPPGVRQIQKRAIEPIPKKQKTDNLPSIITYTPDEFVRFFLGFDDKENVTILEILRELKEGAKSKRQNSMNIVKSDAYRLSLAEFLSDSKKYESKLKSLYQRLRKSCN